MNKGEYTMEQMGPYNGNGDKEPYAESKGDQDDNDLAVFGKKPQLKVRAIVLGLEPMDGPLKSVPAQIRLYFHGRFDVYSNGNVGGPFLVSQRGRDWLGRTID